MFTYALIYIFIIKLKFPPNKSITTYDCMIRNDVRCLVVMCHISHKIPSCRKKETDLLMKLMDEIFYFDEPFLLIEAPCIGGEQEDVFMERREINKYKIFKTTKSGLAGLNHWEKPCIFYILINLNVLFSTKKAIHVKTCFLYLMYYYHILTCLEHVSVVQYIFWTGIQTWIVDGLHVHLMRGQTINAIL